MKNITFLVAIVLFFCQQSSGQNIPEILNTSDEDFYPEDITIVNDIAYVSGLGDGTVKMFDLSQANPAGETFAEAEEGYTQAWGLKSDGTVLLSILDNADFTGGAPGPSKLVEYDLASGEKTGEWDLPLGAIGHTVSIVDGKYYVTDFGSPRIFEVDPVNDTVNDNWFSSPDWDPGISGIGGTIYNNEGAFYVSQGNKLWYLPIMNGAPGTLQEVSVEGLDIIDADGISWDDSQNTLYYATNDTGDPANVGTVYKLVFSDETTATGSIVATGLDDSSGLWYYELDGEAYVFVLESQFGALFGINGFEPPFNIEIISLNSLESLSTSDEDFFPEDITIVNDIAYVSGLGDGTVKMFDLSQANPAGETFAEAEEGYTQAWGLKSDGTVLLSILDNADFTGGAPGPSKLVEYDLASGEKTGEWDLPLGAIGHTVSIVDGKYYVTDFGSPRIFEVDPVNDTVNDNWFSSPDWDPGISGIGGTIYNNEGAFYVSQGNKLWYLPIMNGAPGTLQEVSVEGLDIIDADGISWDDSQNTLYYATNDTGDPANVGTVYKLVFSDETTATGSIVATGLDDSSGLWYYELDGEAYVFVLESQFGALFGINGFEPPFNIEIISLTAANCSALDEVQLNTVCSADNTSYEVIVSGSSDYVLIDNNSGETYSVSGNVTLGPFDASEVYDFTISLDTQLECSQTYSGSVACVTVSVELLSFVGSAEESANLLSWQTASEIETDYFVLERSDDGSDFSELARVAAKAGTHSRASYFFADSENLKGVLYYRLSEIEQSGTTKVVSNVLTIERDFVDFEIVSISPVPVSTDLQISLSSSKDDFLYWFTCDLTGKVVDSGQQDIPAGFSEFYIPVGDYAKGAYQLLLSDGEQNHSVKFIR